MSDSSKDLELFHYGIKGMKWGVSRDVGANGRVSGRAAKKIEKQDKKFEKAAGSQSTFVKVYNRAADISNRETIPKINAKPEYDAAAKRGDLMGDTPINRKYTKEYEREFLKNLNTAASELGTNASGTRKYSIASDDSGNWRVQTDDVQHALTTAFIVRIKRASDGKIINLEMVKDGLSHSDLVSNLSLFGYNRRGSD